LEALSGDGKEMLRSRLAQRRIGGEEGFSWRGEDVLRIEGLADAVFGFALTLLVVSLEVPNTFNELIATMRGFFAFAISGWLLYSVWFDHYIFFRRYGLQDNLTLHLSSVLLFVVLFYVYPLKFLFTALMDQLLGFSTQVGSSTGAVVQQIKSAQWPQLLVLFGVGFVVVQLVYFLLYWRAYDLRDMLNLDAYEASITREQLQGYLLLAGIGLASIAIALIGGEEASAWAGWVYLLSWPLMAIHGNIMARRRRQSASLR
jgi:uncharacterized membrane protein